ncbi:Sodium/calcium exchanger protein-domain-containing protein [Coniella lustricola]|uniref:Sodium/calcium exchanger protein-domain-containing protein n=1 Tax=Coniella lustricola TaxID=2025994 RepID=A0A2T2ZWA1_9PEZI|nr:Sodium/calcium exchanger protein-domain-containing protein [Coniella lustricola]
MIGSTSDRGRGRPRKPPMTRRASSNVQAPHRGGVFSADDALEEVEADQIGRQQSYSTLRRRANAPPPLGRIPSSREVGSSAEDIAPRTPAANAEDGNNDDEMTPVAPAREEPDMEEDLGLDDDDDDDDDRDTPGDDDLDDGDVSDAESFTLKDRQQAINETHPFGIRLWKPALYKKDRSVQKIAEGDIHSSPGGRVSSWLLFFNVLWTIWFGWWLALLAFSGALVCFIFAASSSGREYGRVLWGLAGYILYPFGKFIRLEQQEAYLDEDQGEGRSISEYEQWQSGDLEYGRLFFGPDRGRSIIGRSRRSIDSEPSETDSLLGRGRGDFDDHESDSDPRRLKRRLFGRGQWNIGRVIFFLFFYLLITPSLFIVSAICWFLVFWIPMGKVTMLLFNHLRRHPLALSFEHDNSYAREPAAPHSSVIVCTYRAVGLKYWKYTVDGTNIFLINLMAVVLFVIFDYLVLEGVLHVECFITSSAFLFVAGLLSIIPLAYFIGQAVASISAQSSMGFGAAINAFFSTIVEVFLYCVALKDGKGALVEGSIVGSIFAGILFLPGLSMCFGAIKRKTQRFNARSAGVTSTMLLFAVIGAFGPTLFYQIYGSHELTCVDCVSYGHPKRGATTSDCRRCYFSQTPALDERFYIEAVRPYCYVAALLLFLSYVIGLWFTLRTHAAVIWNSEQDEKKHEEVQQLRAMASTNPAAARSAYASLADSTATDIRESHIYKRTLGQTLKQVGLQANAAAAAGGSGNGTVTTPHLPPPKNNSISSTVHIPGFSEAENSQLVHQIAEIATTAAAAAARDARGSINKGTAPNTPHLGQGHAGGAGGSIGAGATRPPHIRTATFPDHEDPLGAHADAAGGHGGHDAPNWSRSKSAVILMGATVLYAIIAEILVDTVDVVLNGIAIDEKFLGITLFALVPNTTEFLNAISFAMNGNIALSMEIGSAYALQVCLLQIPALVLFSALYPITPADPLETAKYTFSLLFPQWDMVTVILCVFLLSYMYGEGKSNYFKGSILLLSYLVVVVGYYFSGFGAGLDAEGRGGDMGPAVSRFDTWSVEQGAWVGFESVGKETMRTVGRTVSGVAV